MKTRQPSRMARSKPLVFLFGLGFLPSFTFAGEPDSIRRLGASLGIADFNQDDQEDIGVFRNGMWFVTDSPDYAGVDRAIPFGSAVPGRDTPEVGEFGCLGGGRPDGQMDLATLRRAYSTWQVTLSPDWGSSPDLSVTFGTTNHKRLPTRWLDSNGDGCSDFGVFRNGCFYIMESPDYANTDQTVCFGLGTDEPLAAELDGDERSDLILWRAGSAHYTYRLSTEGFSTDHGANLGSGELPLVGDFNGDGRADLGSFKQLYATFRFTYSPDFVGVDLTSTHGTNGDVPVIADVNGDGVADLGIFRNSNARWWFKCSPGWSSSCISQSFGTAGDVPIYGTAVGQVPSSEMVAVPAGAFNMGSNAGYSNWQPAHAVYLNAFSIDRTEVTVAQYNACVFDGACAIFLVGATCNWGFPGRENHPMNCIDWYRSSAYCAWAGKRLPTEAEWEKAARGTDERTYPWGEEYPTCTHAVMNDPATGRVGCDLVSTWPVGSKPLGVSPYGALDMSGNVWEWVGDWYSSTYYSVSPPANPPGPPSGSYKVMRGGSWFSQDITDNLEAAFRFGFDPSSRDSTFGLRCARDG